MIRITRLCYDTGMVTNQKYSLISYTYAHLAVDLGCFYLLFHYDYTDAILIYLLYDLIAFGLQFLFGALLDKYYKLPLGIIGIIFVILTFFLPSPLRIIVCGIGNALFHIEGGRDSIQYSNGKYARLGIFVSSGTIGITLGKYLGLNYANTIPLILLAVAFILCLLIKKTELKLTYNREKNPSYLIIILALFIIFIRSLGGISASYLTDNVVLSCIVITLGKALGGILADKFGAKRVIILSYIIAIATLSLGNNSTLILIGIGCLNISMPISLGILARQFPAHPGFAFGLSTLALILGALPSFYISLNNPYLIFFALLSALVASYFALTIKEA